MRILVNEKLSEHRYKTPEGYLVCTDAILARTGKQTYKRGEVFGQDCSDSEADVEVDRTAKEVFSDATLASFENKPLTVEHPEENVNVDNHNQYAVGFVRDVKRANVDGQDVMTGTLVITDGQTIREIENGEHTDLSCGYDCDILDEENPQQRNIRGNHVALCQQGRAGIARIIDSVDDSAFYILGSDGSASRGAVIVASTKEEALKKYLSHYPNYTRIKFNEQARKEDIENAKKYGGYFDSTELSISQELDDTIEKLKGMQKDIVCDDLAGKYGIVTRKNVDQFLRDYNAIYHTKLYADGSDIVNSKGMDLYHIGAAGVQAAFLERELNAARRSEGDSIEDGYGILSSGQEAKLRRYCDHYDVDFRKAYDELKRRADKRPYASIDNVIDDLLEDIASRKWKDAIKDEFYIVATEEGDTWYNAAGKPVDFKNAKRFSTYGEADRWRRSFGSGSVQKVTDEVKDDINILAVKRKNAAVDWMKKKGLYEEFINKGLYRKYSDYDYAVLKGMPKMEDSVKDEHTYKLYLRNIFGSYKLCDWPAASKEAAVKEFLEANPSYKNKGTIEARDSVSDVNPREGESKDEFISRFMKETVSEYPDAKQRYAVALSYWDKNKVMKSNGKDSMQWFRVSIPGEKEVHLVRATSIEDAIRKISRR